MARPADPHARQSLIAAARAQFFQHGLLAARIEDITRDCSLSKGAFYLHFKSKESLFGEVVQSLFTAMNEAVERRQARTDAFFRQRRRLTAHDIQRRSDRYEAFLKLETEGDREVLSLLWDYRDVVGVLMSGSGGTQFAGMVWEMAGLEVQRVQGEVKRMKGYGAYRDDVPPELFGSMVVGTWLLIAQRMSVMEKKPDLDVWVEALHRLLREGSAPALGRASQKKKSLTSTPLSKVIRRSHEDRRGRRLDEYQRSSAGVRRRRQMGESEADKLERTRTAHRAVLPR